MESQVTTFGPKNKRGVCSICGQVAYDGRATKCDTHRKTPGKRQAVRPVATADAPITMEELQSVSEPNRNVVATPPRSTAPVTITGDSKKDRTAQIKRQILTEANPHMLKGFAFTLKEIPAENFFTVVNGKATATDLTAGIPFADWEAGILAKAAAELENNPAAQTMQAMAAPVMPYAVAMAAMGVVLFHGFQVMQTRTLIIQKWAESQQAQPAPAPAIGDAPADPLATVTQLRPLFTADDLAGPDEESVIHF